jgi:hypothetical protein
MGRCTGGVNAGGAPPPVDVNPQAADWEDLAPAKREKILAVKAAERRNGDENNRQAVPEAGRTEVEPGEEHGAVQGGVRGGADGGAVRDANEMGDGGERGAVEEKPGAHADRERMRSEWDGLSDAEKEHYKTFEYYEASTRLWDNKDLTEQHIKALEDEWGADALTYLQELKEGFERDGKEKRVQQMDAAIAAVTKTRRRLDPELVKRDYDESHDIDLVHFIEKVRSVPKEDASINNYVVSSISERQREAYENLTGNRLKAGHNVLNGDEVIHTDKRHGEKGSADHSMADVNDMARVGYILENFDDIGFATEQNGKQAYSRKYRTSDNKAAPIILYVKRVNGHYIAAEAANDGKKGGLNIISTYKNETNPLDNKLTQEALAPGNPKSDVRNDLASTNNIQPAPEKVNTQDKNILDGGKDWRVGTEWEGADPDAPKPALTPHQEMYKHVIDTYGDMSALDFYRRFHIYTTDMLLQNHIYHDDTFQVDRYYDNPQNDGFHLFKKKKPWSEADLKEFYENGEYDTTPEEVAEHIESLRQKKLSDLYREEEGQHESYFEIYEDNGVREMFESAKAKAEAGRTAAEPPAPVAKNATTAAPETPAAARKRRRQETAEKEAAKVEEAKAEKATKVAKRKARRGETVEAKPETKATFTPADVKAVAMSRSGHTNLEADGRTFVHAEKGGRIVEVVDGKPVPVYDGAAVGDAQKSLRRT